MERRRGGREREGAQGTTRGEREEGRGGCVFWSHDLELLDERQRPFQNTLSKGHPEDAFKESRDCPSFPAVHPRERRVTSTNSLPAQGHFLELNRECPSYWRGFYPPAR